MQTVIQFVSALMKSPGQKALDRANAHAARKRQALGMPAWFPGATL